MVDDKIQDNATVNNVLFFCPLFIASIFETAFSEKLFARIGVTLLKRRRSWPIVLSPRNR